MTNDATASAKAFLNAWTASVAERDVEAGRALRTPDYRCTTPGGQVLSVDEDLASVAALDLAPKDIVTQFVEASGDGAEMLLRFDLTLAGGHTYRCDMTLVERDGTWRAASLLFDNPYRSSERPRPLRRMLGRLRRKLRPPAAPVPGFQELAYAPYVPGSDYALPRSRSPAPIYDESALPLPPQELWLGYNYPAHGAQHVRTMLDMLGEQGFEPKAGDRILDLGCGAGRMIRHLAPLAKDCEIWGADISAEHILWCQRNLTPPFHFFTNTKVPHLPFPDASFALVYCGSVYTHIDDMARAWLLELRRVIRDDGFAYVTIHDEETIALFEGFRDPPAVARHIMSAPLWQEAKQGSDMFTIGRDARSQVFYARDWFTRLAEPMFEVAAVLPRAYFYQTALVLRPSGKR